MGLQVHRLGQEGHNPGHQGQHPGGRDAAREDAQGLCLLAGPLGSVPERRVQPKQPGDQPPEPWRSDPPWCDVRAVVPGEVGRQPLGGEATLLPGCGGVLRRRALGPHWRGPGHQEEDGGACARLGPQGRSGLEAMVHGLLCGPDDRHLLLEGVHEHQPWLQGAHASHEGGGRQVHARPEVPVPRRGRAHGHVFQQGPGRDLGD
mmetsp:Transcript_560/g.1541  ORF Transcript_560/g.1541 Transcript_560/m.1541 type:complete len:204 (-) Transcript_560:44-655(-)